MTKSFGVLTPEEFKAALEAPAGGALKIIRKKDPMWGRSAGEVSKFKVRVYATATVTEEDIHTFDVEAINEDQAKEAAEILAKEHDWDWSSSPDDVQYNSRIIK